MSQKRRQLVVVEWEDCSSYDRWMPFQNLERAEPLQCQTVGWIVRSDKKAKTVVSTISYAEDGSENNATGDMTIPSKCIKRIRKLRG